MHRLYLHRAHSRCECDIAKNIKVELRAPVLTLFFLPFFQHFLNTFIICSGETNSSLMSNIIKTKNDLSRCCGLSPEKSSSPLSSLHDLCVSLLQQIFLTVILNICFKDVSLSHNKMGWTGVHDNLAVRRRHSVGPETVSERPHWSVTRASETAWA